MDDNTITNTPTTMPDTDTTRLIDQLIRINLITKVLKNRERTLRRQLDDVIDTRVDTLDGNAWVNRTKDATGWKVTDPDAYGQWMRKHHPELVTERVVTEVSPIAMTDGFIANEARLADGQGPDGTELVHTAGRIVVHSRKGFLDDLEQVAVQAPRLIES